VKRFHQKISRDGLIALAGERVFKRGEEYFAWGRVRTLAKSGGALHAIVDGAQSYQVSLQTMNSRIGHECTCPVGRSGGFCKHCVAVCLAAMRLEEMPERTEEPVHLPDLPLPDLKDCIEGLPHAELVAMALDEAMHNVRFAVMRRRRHQQEVARQRRKQLAQPVTFGVFDLAAEERGRELMGLVANNPGPTAIRGLELILHIFIAREFIQPRDDQIGFQKPICRCRRLPICRW
jgi:SWIM zinc finger